MFENSGPAFLHKTNRELHTTPPVEKEMNRKKREGEKTSQKPVDKIGDFMDVLERVNGHHDDPKVLERIKKVYHKKHVIKETDVPESQWNLQRKILINEGRGGDFEQDETGKIFIPDNIKEQQTEVLITDQKSTLNTWIEYLSSKDAPYPMWAKYWTFNSMVKMANYDKKKQFGKRKKRYRCSISRSKQRSTI